MKDKKFCKCGCGQEVKKFWIKGHIFKFKGLSKKHRKKIGVANIGKHSVSEERRKKLSEWHKGKRLTEETKRKLSLATKGKNNPMYGTIRHHSKETRRRISIAGKGRIPWCTGKHLSEETKRKIGLASKGNKNPMYGKSPNTHKHNVWYKGMYLRCSYELRFVKACEKYNIHFEQGQESNRIFLEDENGKFSYKPDFLVGNQIIEIKGWDGPRTLRIKSVLKKIDTPHFTEVF